MTNLIGKPHFEVCGVIGTREFLIGRYAEFSQANEIRRDYLGMEAYKTIVVRFRPF